MKFCMHRLKVLYFKVIFKFLAIRVHIFLGEEGGGGAERVYLIVDSTTIWNVFYNILFAPKSGLYNIKINFNYL